MKLHVTDQSLRIIKLLLLPVLLLLLLLLLTQHAGSVDSCVTILKRNIVIYP